MVKIYLDDKRPTPEGFIRTYTVEETIELIRTHNGNIETVSLDNDLGDHIREGRDVMKWIEERAFHDALLPIPNLLIHSGNPVAIDEMRFSSNNAWKFWRNHGYDKARCIIGDFSKTFK